MAPRTPKKVIVKSVCSGLNESTADVHDLTVDFSSSCKMEVYNTVKEKVTVRQAKKKFTSLDDANQEIQKVLMCNLTKEGEIGKIFHNLAVIVRQTKD